MWSGLGYFTGNGEKNLWFCKKGWAEYLSDEANAKIIRLLQISKPLFNKI